MSSFANGLTSTPARPTTRGRHSTGSFNLLSTGSKSTKTAAQKSMRSAIAERGGVIRKADGFEVFYGLNGFDGTSGAPLKAKTVPQQSEQPDGYEIFYDIKQQPTKVQWKTPNMTPEKENQDSPVKGSPKEASTAPAKLNPEKNSADEGENDKIEEEEEKTDKEQTEDVEGLEQQSLPVEESSDNIKPPTVCAFNIATPATSFAPPLMGQYAGLAEGQPAVSADPLDGDALAKELMSRLSSNLPRNVEAFSIATPAASFAPPQMSHRARVDSTDMSEEEKKTSPILAATVIEDESRPGEPRRGVKDVRAVATRAMAGIPERASAVPVTQGYPLAAPRTFTISASRFPAVVAKNGRTSTGGPGTGTISSTGSTTKGRVSVPGNFRPSPSLTSVGR